jgi:hypothetical protein
MTFTTPTKPVFDPAQMVRSHRAPKILGPPSSIAYILTLCSGRRPDLKSGSVICLGRGKWAIIMPAVRENQLRAWFVGLYYFFTIFRQNDYLDLTTRSQRPRNSL